MSEQTVQERMKNVKHTILVLSGKGGVGKSTCALQLATSLSLLGMKVGLLDTDVCGPSLPTMTGKTNCDVIQSADGWSPVPVTDNLSVMSIGFLLPNQDDPVVWRGPRKTGMITQFLTLTNFGQLDYLIIDTPPGTSDEHLAIVQSLTAARPDGCVLVSTPQDVATLDVRKEISFARKMNITTLGFIENMSGFACPDCSHVTHIFGKGGGEALAREAAIPFLGHVPLDPELAEAEETGAVFLEQHPDSATAAAWRSISQALLAQIPSE
ncbi:ATPase MipZ/NubP2/Cfd1 [Carpediemonas membranifera]|uniref:ATPase MipZ/NubP2/Cfd1 n=1 Tax=Carpediemonas membranifera TaxID=201153 RepID=A0A8J6E330_9EUKA|nr:ATPase MipZ/NubP2/Cfd1 [Carpediemonas membranifera]|eukprot:KAG9395408.1 ATPase MipZ/NubP2/Cfd1 [Carpediemonas membranifera]